MHPLVNVSNMSRIITPYLPDRFEYFLARFDLSNCYPTLVHRLRNGFPIGNFSPLLATYIHPNHGSFREHEAEILEYILEEVSLGRMSGPFSAAELRREFGGEHFISSPLGAVDKAGEPGKFRTIRDLSHKGKAPHSVNDEVNADEETTRWGKASDMAEIVSPYSRCSFYNRCTILYIYHSRYLFVHPVPTHISHSHLRPYIYPCFTLFSCRGHPSSPALHRGTREVSQPFVICYDKVQQLRVLAGVWLPA